MNLKEAQKIYYYDNYSDTIQEGVLLERKNQSSFDEEPTLVIRTIFGSRERYLMSWIFETRYKANKFLKNKLKEKIKTKQNEIKHLKQKLKELS